VGESSGERARMGPLAADRDEAARTELAPEGLPSLDARVEMFLRAVHGPQAEPTAAQRMAARAHILDAMAADLAAETVDRPAPAQSAVQAEGRRAISSAAPSSIGWGETGAKITEPLLKLFAPAGEVFAMRAVRMAAVPLLALLVVGTIWTGMLTDREPDPSGAEISQGAGTPRTRGLATPAER